MPQSQKADVRPISFVLHNQATGEPPTKVDLVIRPEDLTRSEPSRLTTHQTIGGAWADNFGHGIPTVNISGHTGWGQGGRPDGIQQFQLLYATVFQRWHAERAAAVEKGLDPDKVKLIFDDMLDVFTWVVAPQSFVLKRNKSRPLLSQYQITLTWLSNDVAETLSELAALRADESIRNQAAIDSLDAALKGIDDFANSITSEVAAFFGPIKDGIATLVRVTARVLHAIRSVIKSGMRVVSAVTDNLFRIGTMLAQASSNVFAAVMAVQTLPGRIKARFMRVRTMFLNAYCILRNVFKRRRFLPNYDDVYGASLCSSTAGGRPLSRYLNMNTVETVLPSLKTPLGVSSDGMSSLVGLVKMDPVLQPPPLVAVGDMAGRAANGVMVMA